MDAIEPVNLGSVLKLKNMKKGFKFSLIGIVSIILVSILKLMGIEKDIVIILYLFSFILEIVGLLYIIDNYNKS